MESKHTLALEFNEATKSSEVDYKKKLPLYDVNIKRYEIKALEKLRIDSEDSNSTSPLNMLQNRKSFSTIMPQAIVSKKDLLTLLKYSYGLKKSEDGRFKGTVPSAGGRYSSYIYLFVFNVEGMEPGIYYWEPINYELHKVYVGNYRQEFVDMIYKMNQIDGMKCSFATIITANIPQTCSKYGDRGYRYLCMDAGHISQNMYLVSGELNLGIRAIGGFYDNEVLKTLNLEKNENAALLVHMFGREYESIERQLGVNSEFYFIERG